jgi:hypothetical protein
LRYGEDIDLWLRIARQGGRVAYQRKILARARLRADSVSADVPRMLEGYLRVLQEIRSSTGLTPADIEVLDRQLDAEKASLHLLNGKGALRRGEVKSAVESLEMANAYFHRPKISAALFLLHLAPSLFMSFYRRAGN